jgi:hypothetical protein
MIQKSYHRSHHILKIFSSAFILLIKRILHFFHFKITYFIFFFFYSNIAFSIDNNSPIKQLKQYLLPELVNLRETNFYDLPKKAIQ